MGFRTILPLLVTLAAGCTDNVPRRVYEGGLTVFSGEIRGDFAGETGFFGADADGEMFVYRSGLDMTVTATDEGVQGRHLLDIETYDLGREILWPGRYIDLAARSEDESPDPFLFGDLGYGRFEARVEEGGSGRFESAIALEVVVTEGVEYFDALRVSWTAHFEGGNQAHGWVEIARPPAR